MSNAETDTQTVWYPPTGHGAGTPRYHYRRECHEEWRELDPIKGTERDARKQNIRPCHKCVGWTCPRCGEHITGTTVRAHFDREHADHENDR